MRRHHRVLITIACVSVAMLFLGCGGKDKSQPSSDIDDPFATGGTPPGSGRELPKPPPPPPPSETPGSTGAGMTERPAINLSDVHFDFDVYTLSTEARTILADDARMLESRPEMQVLIEGHCDERGTIEYNLALGEKRAQAVKEYLERYGIPRDRLSTVSYGEERPLSRESTEAGWAMNRRAHLRER